LDKLPGIYRFEANLHRILKFETIWIKIRANLSNFKKTNSKKQFFQRKRTFLFSFTANFSDFVVLFQIFIFCSKFFAIVSFYFILFQIFIFCLIFFRFVSYFFALIQIILFGFKFLHLVPVLITQMSSANKILSVQRKFLSLSFFSLHKLPAALKMTILSVRGQRLIQDFPAIYL